MLEKISAAEAKSKFSEILSRVRFAHDYFLIERKGKAVAALVDVAALKSIASSRKSKVQRGLLAAVGAWKEFKNMENTISRIYQLRKSSKDRLVHPL